MLSQPANRPKKQMPSIFYGLAAVCASVMLATAYLHGNSRNCMDKGKYDGTDFTVRFGWYDVAVLRNAGTDCSDC